jgi:histidinol-phosphate aminotransferase
VPPGPLPSASDGLALVKSSVRRLTAYSLSSPSARRKLNQNESPFDFPADLKNEVLGRVAAQPWQRYPEFVPRMLQETLAGHYGWVPDGVLVGNGSNELIQATLAVTLGEGDVLVAPSPTFALYRQLTGVFDGRYVPVPLGPAFAFNVDRLIDTARRERARAVVLNSPNNPTGSALPEGAIERLLEHTGALIVCDEAYQEFGGPTAIPLLARSSRIVVLRTFSKAFGLAGLRFGLALAHPEMVTQIAKGKLPYNVNVVTLAVAGAALRQSAALAARLRSVVEVRDHFLEQLSRIRGITAYPSAANFILIRCEIRPAREVFERLHREYDILVRDVSAAPELDQCLRISIGTAEDMDAVAGALEEIFS